MADLASLGDAELVAAARAGRRPAARVTHSISPVSGAPVRVDAAVLSDPEVDAHPEWEQYPARMPDLAAEERQRRADFLARLAREHEGEDSNVASPAQ